MKIFYITKPLRKPTDSLLNACGEGPCTKLLGVIFLGRQQHSRERKSEVFSSRVAHPVSPIMHPDHVSSHLHSPKRRGIHTPYYKVKTGAF